MRFLFLFFWGLNATADFTLEAENRASIAWGPFHRVYEKSDLSRVASIEEWLAREQLIQLPLSGSLASPSFSFQGLGYEANQIFLNGVLLMDPSTPSGSFSLETVPIEMVEKIEVHQNLGTTEWGGRAAGLRIEIWTFHEKPLVGAEMVANRSDASSTGVFGGASGLSGVYAKGALPSVAKDSDFKYPFSRNFLNGVWRHDFVESELQLQASQSERSQFLQAFGSDASHFESHGLMQDFSVFWQEKSPGGVQLQMTGAENHRSYFDPGESTQPYLREQYLGSIYSLRISGDQWQKGILRWRGGVDLQELKYESDQDKEMKVQMAVWQKWIFSSNDFIGLRLEDQVSFPEVEAGVELGESQLVLRRTGLLPSLYQKYDRLYGNRQLKTTELISLSIGYSVRTTDIKMQIQPFLHDVKNSIGFGTTAYINDPGFVARGVDLRMSSSGDNQWNWFTRYQKGALREPVFSSSLAYSYPLQVLPLTIGPSFRFVDSRNYNGRVLSAYSTVNLALHGAGWELMLQNLTSQRPEEMPGTYLTRFGMAFKITQTF